MGRIIYYSTILFLSCSLSLSPQLPINLTCYCTKFSFQREYTTNVCAQFDGDDDDEDEDPRLSYNAFSSALRVGSRDPTFVSKGIAIYGILLYLFVALYPQCF